MFIGVSAEEPTTYYPGILDQVKSVWLRSPDTRDAAMPWAASRMCIFGFWRVGEAVVPSDSGFNTAVYLA